MYSRLVVKAATQMRGIFQLSPGVEPVRTKKKQAVLPPVSVCSHRKVYFPLGLKETRPTQWA